MRPMRAGVLGAQGLDAMPIGTGMEKSVRRSQKSAQQRAAGTNSGGPKRQLSVFQLRREQDRQQCHGDEGDLASDQQSEAEGRTSQTPQSAGGGVEVRVETQ